MIHDPEGVSLGYLREFSSSRRISKVMAVPARLSSRRTETMRKWSPTLRTPRMRTAGSSAPTLASLTSAGSSGTVACAPMSGQSVSCAFNLKM